MRTLTLILLSSMAALLPGQDLTPKAAPQTRSIVIRGATLHTVSGPVIENGTLWFRDGVIRGIGATADAADPADDCEVIDGAGRHVYPGFIGIDTLVGLVELAAVRATVDHAEVGYIKPEVRAAVAVNPDSTHIPVTRANGILTIGVFPTEGLVSGRASVMNLEGWTWEDMAVRQDAGLVVNWPSLRIQRGRWNEHTKNEERELVLAARQKIESLFEDARAYGQAKAADPTLRTDVRLEAMRAVLSGQTPTFIRADETEQIQSAVTWAIRANLRPVLVGGRDAMQCRALLLRHAVPIVVGGITQLPHRRDLPVADRFSLPRNLQEAGLRWCLASGEPFYNERNLPYHAARAVAYGLSREHAVKSITLSTAQALGVDRELGSLEVGKHATLFVCSGDPLDVTGKIEHAFVRGRRIDLSSKHSRLAEKYRVKYAGRTPPGK